MTLKEFIKKTLLENNLNHDHDEVEKNIMYEAKKQAENNCAVISDDEVAKMIVNFKPNEKKKKDDDQKSNKPISPVEQEKEKKCEKEKKPYQTALF